MEYIENCVAEITHDYLLAEIILAGDLNQLSDQNLVERTGMTQIVHQPTRGGNVLDRIFVTNPQLYSSVWVVTSIVKADHRAVVVYPDNLRSCSLPKSTVQLSYRHRSPKQHAQFLRYVANMDFSDPCPIASSDPSMNTQAEFDHFYSRALELLDLFYPEQTVKITSRDPAYITPIIKSMLRRKNRLMRAGRQEEASALSARIGKEITQCCKSQLGKIDSKTGAKDMWKAVKQLTGRRQETAVVEDVTAESLNNHYASISTDQSYTPPVFKQLASCMQNDYVSEWKIFKALDNLRPTATGMDRLPAWFLRVGRQYFADK